MSVAFTVRAMDAGPVLAQYSRPMPPNTQAPQLLAELFDAGTELLLERLPQVWSGEAATLATPQAWPSIPLFVDCAKSFRLFSQKCAGLISFPLWGGAL